MVTGQPLLINWEILPLTSERMKILHVSWIVSTETDPKGRRGIPSWNLSLVLHQLTKAPFEPVKEASLKHLTFKTVFLLALESGKRRSEIHTWQNRNIRHQSDWSKVSLYPSPSFLSENQLSKEGPDSVAPVVIPALAPTLDRSLKSDRSLKTPSRKDSTKTSHLPLSPHGSNRLWSDVMSPLIKRPIPYIRSKPMMSGPLLLLRPSNRESP